MTKRSILLALGLSLAVVGCGGDGTTDDLGETPGADMTFVAFKLDSGTYKNATVTVGTDDCMLKLEDPAGQFVGQFAAPLTVNHTNGMVTFGNQSTSFNPPQPSQGSGVIDNNVGTLTAQGTFMATANCTFNLTRTNMVTVTADNQFMSAFKDVRTSIAGQNCQLPVDCTSTYTLTYAIQ
jgi:hypothetical protein